MTFRIGAACLCLTLGVFLLSYTPVHGQTTVPVAVQFSSAGYSALEGTGSGTSEIEITILLTGTPTEDVSVSYQVDPSQISTATKDVDYVGSSVVGTVTFSKAANETVKTFNVLVYQDDVPEPDETIQLELFGPTGDAILGALASTTVTILNDDAGPAPALTAITATVLSTPPETPGLRMPGGVSNAWAAPIDRSFQSVRTIQENANGTLAFPGTMFDAPNAIVVFQLGKDIALAVTATNLGTRNVTFAVVRAPDDDASIGGAADLPTLTRTAATTATLETNQHGSFQVVAFIDQNGNGKWDSSEKGLSLSYILVWAQATNMLGGDRTQVNAGLLGMSFVPNDTAPRSVRLKTGGSDAATAAISFDADITLLGGGGDGKRGLDRVFLGWHNNLISATEEGNYPAIPGGVSHQIKTIFVTNSPKPRTFIDGRMPAPVPAGGLSLPLLDTSRTPTIRGGSRDGGIDVMLSTSPVDGKGTVTALTRGEMRTITAIDSPSGGISFGQPLRGATSLRAVNYALAFKSTLMGWSNSTGGSAPTPATVNSVGFRSFTIVRRDQWKFQNSWTIVRPTGRRGALAFTKNPVAGNGIRRGARWSVRTGAPAANIEVRPPTALETAVNFLR